MANDASRSVSGFLDENKKTKLVDYKWTNYIIRTGKPENILTSRHGLHVFGKFATHAIIVGADVMQTPGRELFGIVELQQTKGKVGTHHQRVNSLNEAHLKSNVCISFEQE